MRVLILIAYLVAAEASLAAGKEEFLETEMSKLDNLSYDDGVKWLAELSVNNKTALIDAIKQKYSNELRSPYYTGLLVHLGDDETIRQQAELLMHGDYQDIGGVIDLFRTCRDPQVIAAMCPVFLINGDPDQRVWQSGYVMPEMILSTPGFSAEVYTWAKEMGNVRAASFMGRFVFRDWWKANKTAFEKKDYVLVKPGPLVATENLHEEAQSNREYFFEPPSTLPSAVNARKLNRKSEEIDRKSDNGGEVLFGVVSGVVVCCMAGVLLVARRRQ